MQPCSMASKCRNSPEVAGIGQAQCYLCRLAPGGEGDRHSWRPIERGIKHPMLEAEKRQAKTDRYNQKLVAKRSRNRDRMKVVAQAARAERATEKKIIRATKNSGRSHKDGDHVSQGLVTLDTKHQSMRENPVVLLHELEKVRSDAARAGNAIGGLVLRTKNNIGVVVFHEDDYARLIGKLANEPAKSD